MHALGRESNPLSLSVWADTLTLALAQWPGLSVSHLVTGRMGETQKQGGGGPGAALGDTEAFSGPGTSPLGNPGCSPSSWSLRCFGKKGVGKGMGHQPIYLNIPHPFIPTRVTEQLEHTGPGATAMSSWCTAGSGPGLVAEQNLAWAQDHHPQPSPKVQGASRPAVPLCAHTLYHPHPPSTLPHPTAPPTIPPTLQCPHATHTPHPTAPSATHTPPPTPSHPTAPPCHPISPQTIPPTQTPPVHNPCHHDIALPHPPQCPPAPHPSSPPHSCPLTTHTPSHHASLPHTPPAAPCPIANLLPQRPPPPTTPAPTTHTPPHHSTVPPAIP